MKHTIIAITLALATAAAQAETIATMPNENGGRIELSDVKVGDAADDRCPARSHIAKTWSVNIDDIYGCWYYDAGARTVTVNWQMPNRRYQSRTYPMSAFRFTESFIRKSRAERDM